MDSTAEVYFNTFGFPKERGRLFDSEEEYDEFRKYILSQPKMNVARFEEELFSNINHISYENTRRSREIRKQIERGMLMFYLKKYDEDNELICDAAGYYDDKNDSFVIIQYSQISKTFRDRLKDVYVNLDGDCFLRKNMPCVPRSAAFFVLSNHAEMSEWKTQSGRTLQSYYSMKNNENQEPRKRTRIIRGAAELQNKISSVISSLTTNKKY